jgi:Ca2+-binding EF-hand superfamily protein
MRSSASVVVLVQTRMRVASLNLHEHQTQRPGSAALNGKAAPPFLPPLDPSSSKATGGGGSSSKLDAAKGLIELTAAERDNLAREKLDRVRAFIEERDRMRPILPAYTAAFRSSLDVNPSPVADFVPRRTRLGAVTKPLRRLSQDSISSSNGVGESVRQDHDEWLCARIPSKDPVLLKAPPGLFPPLESSASGQPTKGKKRRKTKHAMKSGIELLRGRPRPRRTEVTVETDETAEDRDRDQDRGFSNRILDDQLVPAAEEFLQGLEGAPDDERMKQGFDKALQKMKMSTKADAVSGLPFGGGSTGAVKVIKGGSPPGRMRAPGATAMAYDSATLTWEPMGNTLGYELEITMVNALEAHVAEWRKVYRGPKLQHELSKLGRQLTGVRARVRAYNGHGKGEWSPRSELLRMPPIPPPNREEIQEIPSSWLTIDLAGVPDLSAKGGDAALLELVKADLVKVLHANRKVIKVAFCYYALAGVANVDDDPSTMSMVQFGNFCRGAKLLNSHLNSSGIDRIFLRAVRVLPNVAAAGADTETADASLVSALASAGVKATKEWRKAKAAVNAVSLLTKGANLMDQPQFVQALIRLAAARQPGAADGLSIADKLSQMLGDYVEHHVLREMQLIEDDFSPHMRTRAMGAVLERHRADLERVFFAYAAADQQSSAAAKRALTTMNVLECNELCEDIGIFDETFITRDLLSAFVMVNIDDDLYYQEQAENTSSELVFDEFEEFVARIFNKAVWSKAEGKEVIVMANLLDQDGDGDLDEDDVDDLFDECDVDKSGAISIEELAAVLTKAKRLNDGAAKLVAEKLMAFADTDKSGTISKDELREAVIKMASGKAEFEERGQALERAFDAWLHSIFVPRALQAIKKKKLEPAPMAAAPAQGNVKDGKKK